MSDRTLKYSEALREAVSLSMDLNPNVYIIGLGVPDPVNVFGTTKGLKEKFGGERVLDMPISENAVTGVLVGSALSGMRPVMVHMRLEFALLSIDQLVNQAAKWHYLSAGEASVPLTIRMIVGRGWGQSSQHSQCLHAWFAHVPGLKVIMPSTPYDAKGLLIAAIEDNSPVVCIEHRWLYDIHGPVPPEYYQVKIGVPKISLKGSDITVVASSYMTIEALKAAKILAEEGIQCEIIDLRTLNPLDPTLIFESIQKTGHLVVCDQGTYTAGYAAEIVSRVTESCFSALKSAPIRVTLPDVPVPSTRALANYYYPGPNDIVYAVKKCLGKHAEDPKKRIKNTDKLDVFDFSFTGPF